MPRGQISEEKVEKSHHSLEPRCQKYRKCGYLGECAFCAKVL